MAEDGYKVTLNVYDLSQGLARQLSTTFLGKAIEGIWHTGIIVYESEYYFGGGIQHSPVGKTPYGSPIRVVDLGVTHVPKEVFEEYLQEISPRYTAETYSLLTHNCNNFTNEVAQFLVGANIPDYILQLPNEVMNSPMGPLILPMIQNLETTLRSGAVPQAPQFSPSVTQPFRVKTNSSFPNTSFREVTTNNAESPVKSKNQHSGSTGKKTGKPVVPPAVKPGGSQEKVANGVAGHPLGDARSKVQEEISKEFSAIMATGTLRASEAAALATRRVMERYGRVNVAMPHS
ncbi:desumoylating isopeptidase 1 [Telopea speciosissima]|uniref:desumoylating isopeptidase 1 n=1 Tax=Telopea speciosissima TaxID=54955 RepID=UPI001CC689AC|nr:desumoylating isopeptidase 1 [Telopea speciosissima]